jgi:protein phosphatase
MIDCFGLTDIGRVRKRNEDQFFIADLTRPVVNYDAILSRDEEWDGEDILHANLLLVADGVGGNAGGERASRKAVEAVVEYLHSNRKGLLRDSESDGDRVFEDLKSALVWARHRIQLDAEGSPHYARMGTTLTLAYLAWPTAYIAHVGDSRAYLFRQQKLVQLTHDQTIAQMLADAGAIKSDDVRRHPLRHALGSLIGCSPGEFHPSVHQTRLDAGDQLLLCTDGLTERVRDAQIANILSGASSAERACRQLIAAANAAGGNDNATVVVSCFGRHVMTRGTEPDARHVGERGAATFAPLLSCLA